MTLWITLGWCGLGWSYPPIELKLLLMTIGCGQGVMLESFRDGLREARDGLRIAAEKLRRAQAEVERLRNDLGDRS